MYAHVTTIMQAQTYDEYANSQRVSVLMEDAIFASRAGCEGTMQICESRMR